MDEDRTAQPWDEDDKIDLVESEEEAALASALRSMNHGQNSFCWPLLSYGMENADLSERGCTGVRSILYSDALHVRVEVGGHRTFRPLRKGSDAVKNTHYERAMDLIRGCGFDAVITDTDWSVYEDIDITVPWVRDLDGRANPRETARLISSCTESALTPFCEEMCAITDVLLREFEPMDFGPRQLARKIDWPDPPEG